MRIYGIYDLKQNELCMRVGTLKEISIFLNMTAREAGRALRKKNNLRGQYEICYLYNE